MHSKRIVTALVTAAIFALSAGQALAAHVSSGSGGAYIRAQPDINSTQYGYFGNDTELTLYCYKDGGWAEGTNRWFQVNVPSYQYGSPEAYINANLVADQYNVPACP